MLFASKECGWQLWAIRLVPLASIFHSFCLSHVAWCGGPSEFSTGTTPQYSGYRLAGQYGVINTRGHVGARPLYKKLYGTKERDTNKADTRVFTFWPLGIAAFRLYVFSQPSLWREKGLTKDSILSRFPSGQKVNARVSPFSIIKNRFLVSTSLMVS